MYDNSDDNFALIWAKRIKAINYLGGKCEECGCNDVFSMDFHHPDDNKEHGLSYIRNFRWSLLKKEIDKCRLLCSNCHYEHHYVSGRATQYKQDVLDLMKIDAKCSICGYRGKNLRSLTFHHNDKNKKEMNLSCAFARKHAGCSLQDIVDEINKCSIICMNCHRNLHINKEKFNRLELLIYEKIKNYKEQKTINEKIVSEFKKEGKGICEIARILDCNKSSIFYVFHRV